MIRIASPPENVVGQFMPPAHHAILLSGSSTKPRPCWTKRCQFDKDFETVTIVLLNLSAAKKIRTYFDLDSETIAHEHASKICV
mmetsp:Transcript_11753/g.16832  ORF Transcript_11753/g.16832 Transcript_11753/m.16832 type:complete len:84 (+) Transcript_11753:1657-1908(+)